MKKLMGYAIVMLAVIIILPLAMVRGCGASVENEPYKAKEQPTVDSTTINIYDHVIKKQVIMDLEEYIKGVVAAEMPADFELEALKAQAVAARTFAYGRLNGTYKCKEGDHDGIPICTNPCHCQAWISKAEAKKKWGILFASRNWSRIEKAVNGTKGVVLEYEGETANALFHSNSGGRTENCEEVWEGVSVPYLRSVVSRGEEDSKAYRNVIKIKIKDFVKKMNNAYPGIDIEAIDVPRCIKIIDHTSGGRVDTLKVADVEMKGTEFRVLFELKSANFAIEKTDKETLTITTYGYGHGVGMSQYGANYLAKRGGIYSEILKYYYIGVDLVVINQQVGKLSN